MGHSDSSLSLLHYASIFPHLFNNAKPGDHKKKIENRPIFKELPVIINKGNKSHGKVEGKVMKGW